MMRKGRWDRHAIKAEIGRRGSSLLAIARDAGLEPSSTRVALRRRHPAGEEAIAAFLGVDPAVLWPERYPARITAPASSSADSSEVASPNLHAA